MDLGVEPKGGGVLAAAGHADQGRDALGPPENRPNRSVELGLGMDGEMPSLEGGTGQQHDERDQAGNEYQFVFPHLRSSP